MTRAGIVRRIDDLGRIVIPKEIRRVLHIKDSDPMEIFAGRDGEIVLRKYSPVGELEQIAADIVESLAASTGTLACITDRDCVIAISGTKWKNLEGKAVSHDLENIMNKRTAVVFQGQKNIAITKTENISLDKGIVIPILTNGDCAGSILVMGKTPGNFEEEKVQPAVRFAAMFLAMQMEV